MILLDTDHLSILVDRQTTRHAQLIRRLESAGDSIGVPVIGVEEQCRGWLAKIHHTRDVHHQIPSYERLIEFFRFMEEWEIVPFEAAAASTFKYLRRQRIRIGSQDLKIAAIALTQGALLLSANLRDYLMVSGVRVENWLKA